MPPLASGDPLQRRFARRACLRQLAGGVSLLSTVGMATAANKVVQRDFAVAPFHGVHIVLACDAQLSPASSARVTVSAEPPVQERIRIRVERGMLVVDSQGSFSTQSPVRVKIDFTALDRLQAEGSSHVQLSGLRGAALDVQVDGSAELKATGLDLASISVKATGSGNVRLVGRAVRQTLAAAGSSGLHAAGLTGEQAKVQASDAATLEVAASAHLDAAVQDAGTVRYKGRPKLVKRVEDAGTLESMS